MEDKVTAQNFVIQGRPRIEIQCRGAAHKVENLNHGHWLPICRRIRGFIEFFAFFIHAMDQIHEFPDLQPNRIAPHAVQRNVAPGAVVSASVHLGNEVVRAGVNAKARKENVAEHVIAAAGFFNTTGSGNGYPINVDAVFFTDVTELFVTHGNNGEKYIFHNALQLG